MILTANEAHDLCCAAFAKTGMADSEASAVADVLVEAELWGKPTHGLCRVVGLAERYRNKTLAPVQVLKDEPACLHLDAGTQLGYVVLRAALDQAMDKAQDAGLCIVGIRNSDHCGIAGYYAWRAASRGFICALTCDCFPRTAPYGATTPVFGTNPVALGVPTVGDPVVLDFSIAEMTNGFMNTLIAEGRPLPEGVGFDADGRPTTSPQACMAGAVKAFGGHKGSGIAIFAQLMCTAFVGATPIPPMAVDYGYAMVLLKPDLFVPLGEFHARAQVLLAAVRSARPEAGRDRVLLPGERSLENKRRAEQDGFEIADAVVDDINQFIRDT